MKKYIIVLVILGVFIFCCFPVGAKEINPADVRRIVISDSIVTIEKKNGDIFLIGSGRSKDNARDIKEKEIGYDYFLFHVDKYLPDWDKICNVLDDLIKIDQKEKANELLLQAINLQLKKLENGKISAAEYLFERFGALLKEKEYNEIYDLLEGYADTKMEEKKFSEAAYIYKAIGDMEKYQEAKLIEAKQNEEKKYWEAAAYDYNAAGRPEKAIDMWRKELQRIKDFRKNWKKEHEGHTYFSTFGTGHEEEDIKKESRNWKMGNIKKFKKQREQPLLFCFHKIGIIKS
ncbi:hypothetical protein KKA27_00965 [Patescibacteria group bacterium]|nr:hypothetical protein [Patescibacteria group bacterium]MBU2632991.1 hypothetical protein [Patescibacteria group bacterium]